MADDVRPLAALVAVGGVFLPAHLAEPLWRVLRTEILRRHADGGRVPADMQQALDVLRAAALAYLNGRGHVPRTSADIVAPSRQPTSITTADLAAKLRVTPRHARRIAHTEGIAPAARNRWAREDVAALIERRGLSA